MKTPEMHSPAALGGNVHLLPSYAPVPGFGVLPVNSFVIGGAEPILVDTGLAALREPFLDALGDVMDPEDLRWIWLTHADADHMGNLAPVLDRAPGARLVTNFIGMAKLGLQGVPLDRVYLINPGQALDLPDRRLNVLRPPTYDAPETMAFLDEATATLFSSDSFGALLQRPAERASDIASDELEGGGMTWATIDSPWLPLVDPGAYRRTLDRVRALAPARILSSHLPPAVGMTGTLTGILDRARSAPPFPAPDQAALEAMMAA